MDAILYWNDVALEANRVSHTKEPKEQAGPTLSSRAIAMVHLAMYDAFAGVSASPATLPPYLPGLPAPPSGASRPAAVAAAAHTVLSALYPSQKEFFDLRLAQAQLHGSGVGAGRAYGVTIAEALLDDRKDDPDAGAAGYIPSWDRGRHRLDPDNPRQGFHGPFYGALSKGFSVQTRHKLQPPPAISSSEYQDALRQVRAKGIAPELMAMVPAADRRTAEEYTIGIYWGYDGALGLGTPPRLYNQIVRAVALAQGNSEEDNARLFALVNAAMGDAGILAWEDKYKHDYWRPVVGIREHDASMGPAGTAGNAVSADCDPHWLPLGAPSTNALSGSIQHTVEYPCQQAIVSLPKNFTPPFPAYPSGHATFGAAALHMTRLFYHQKDPALLRGKDPKEYEADDLFKDDSGNDLAFVSEEFNGINTDNKGTVRPRHVRSFPGGLWQMIEENGFSRVYLGVHWSFDSFSLDSSGKPDYSKFIGGVPLGLKIAEDIFVHGNGEAPKKSTV